MTFRVVSGPNAGVTGSAITNVNGQATFQYSSSVTGTDTLQANVGSVTSNTVTKTWVSGAPRGLVGNGTPTRPSAGVVQVPLTLANAGGDDAVNIKITNVSGIAPAGITYAGPALPISEPNLAVGASETQNVRFNVGATPSGTIMKFTVTGTYDDSSAHHYTFTATRQIKIP